MRNSKKLAAAITSFGAASLCLVGGTFAWYTVSNTGTASWSGTTATGGGSLKIGIVPEKEETKTLLLGKDFVNDTTDTTVYWCPTDDNNSIKAADLNAAFASDDYSDDSGFIAPVTTGSYADTDDGSTNAAIALYEQPDNTSMTNTGVIANDLHNIDNKVTSAAKGKYIKFTLAFNANAEDKEIYINSAGTKFTATDGNVIKTLRIGFSSTDAGNYIYSPAYVNDAIVNTNVGGVLDTDANGVNDHTSAYITNDFGDESNEEGDNYYDFYYGEYEDLDEGATLVSKYQKETDSDNLVHEESGTSRDAWAGKEFMPVQNVSGVERPFATWKPVGVTAKKQQARGLYYFAYKGAESTTNHPVAITDENGIAKVTVTMWVEGWEPSSASVANGLFNASLDFVAPSLGEDIQ